MKAILLTNTTKYSLHYLAVNIDQRLRSIQVDFMMPVDWPGVIVVEDLEKIKLVENVLQDLIVGSFINSKVEK